VDPSLQFALAIALAVTVAKALLLRGKTDWLSFSRGVSLSPRNAVISIFASLAGGFMVFGIVQVGFEGGVSGFALGFAYVVGLPLLSWGLRQARKVTDLRSGLFGLDPIIEKTYGPASLVAFYVLTGFVFTGVLGAQLLAIAFYLQAFKGLESAIVVLVIGVAGTICYTVFHGLRGVLLNDMIQGVVALLVAVIVPLCVWRQVNAHGVVTFDPLSEGFSGTYSLAYPIVGALTLIPSFVVRADLWQRIRLVDESKYKVVLWSTAGLLFFFYSAMTAAGLLIRDNPHAFPFLAGENPGAIVPLLIQNIVDSWLLRFLVLCGVLLAILSSVDSYLNIVALAFTHLVLWRTWRSDAIPEAQRSRTLKANAQVMTIAVALLAIVSAALVPDLVDLLSASFALIGVLLAVAGLPLLWPELHRDSTGAIPMYLALFVLVSTFPMLGKIAFIPAIVIGVAAFFTLVVFERVIKWRPSQRRIEPNNKFADPQANV
jgi:Na+/proline symporter